MIWKCLFVTTLVCFVTGSAYEHQSNDGEPYNELPCIVISGLCVESNKCPEGKQVSMKGLCPTQEKRGVQCCHSVPRSVTTCRGRGGECMSKTTNCPERLTFSRATDCTNDEKCCILV